MTRPAPSPAAPGPTSAGACARGVVEEQNAALSCLTRIGMEIAEACGRAAVAQAAEAQDAAPPEPRPFAPHALAGARDPGLTFARVARAVRMTIALQSRLLKDLAALDRAEEDAAEVRKTGQRLRLSRLTVQAAEAAVTERRAAAGRNGYGAGWGDNLIEDEIEKLSEEVYERLTDAEDDIDLEDRPYPEVVAAICGELGLSPDWTARLLAATGAISPPPDPPSSSAHPAEVRGERMVSALREAGPGDDSGLGP